MTTKKERLEDIIRRLEAKNTDNKLDQEIADLKKEVEDWEGIKESPEKLNQSTESNKFTCNNCSGEWEFAKLGKEWKMTDGEFIRHCSTCFEALSNPLPPEKPKKITFVCDYCRTQIFGICDRRHVNVSMPNELGFRHGQIYNLCKTCTRKVQEYNKGDYVNELIYKNPHLRDKHSSFDSDEEIIEKEFGPIRIPADGRYRT